MCWKRRKTVEVAVCASTGLLPNEWCPETVRRKYYVEPRPGEPSVPTTVCMIHAEPPIPPDPPPPDPTITVDVCLASSKLPNIYCPTKISKTFIVGQEPTTACQLHVAPTPVYPPKSKYQFWVFVPELMFCLGDRRAFLKRMRMAGAWGVRVFLCQSWSTVVKYPWKQAIYKGQPVNIIEDGKVSDIKDFTKPNPLYWAELDKLMDELAEFDLGLIASLEDNCSVRGVRWQKKAYPWMGSIQCLSKGEDWPFLVPTEATNICTEATGGIYSKTRYALHKQWIKQAVAFLKNYRNVPLWVELENEHSDLDWGLDSPVPYGWYQTMAQAIRDAGIAKDRTVHSACNGLFKTLQPNLGILSHHTVVRPTFDMGEISESFYPVTMLSGDGGFNGNSPTDIDSKGKHGLSIPDSVALAKVIKQKKMKGYEWMCRLGWSRNDNQVNVNLISDELPKAMIAEFNK